MTYSKGDEVESDGTPVLRANNVDLETGELDLSEMRYIRREIHVPVSKIVEQNSLLICTASGSKKHLGKTALIDRPMKVAFGGFMGLLKPHSCILPKFLYWLTRSPAYWSYLTGLSEGTNINNLKFSGLSGFEVPIPPLEEQKRIVAVLDEAFEGLARARANAEANLNDARELFAISINELMASKSNTHRVALGTVCTFENGDRGKNYPGRKAFVASGVPFINAGHLLNGAIDWDNMNFIPSEHYRRLSNGKVRKGDLLFCLRGSLGKFGIVDTDEPGAIASSLVIVRPDYRLLPAYLAAYFESGACAEMISRFENGAAQPNLSAKNLAAFEINLPSVKVQEGMLVKLHGLRAEISRLSDAYSDQSRHLEMLRQSLLQRAFSGELT
jgi:type I restriction enzyme S subunit